jgi:putative transposase
LDVLEGAGVERGEPGGRAQGDAGTAGPEGIVPAERLPAAAGAGGSGGLPAELVEGALARARLRERGLPVEGLAPEARELLSDELVDELLQGARTEEEIVGPGGLLAELTRRLVERALEVELTEHLGYERHAEPPGGAGNARNGSTPKTLQTEHGPVRIEAPRDRRGTFEPRLVRKRQRRFEGFDDKIVAIYARGMTTREIEAHLHELYGAAVGRDTVSRVTEAVLEDASVWQSRPLEAVYPILYLDALVIKIRDGKAVRNHACYLAIGVNGDGERDVLGIWFQRNEGPKFWLAVLTELKQRGLEDVLVCCVDGPGGFSEAIEAVYPEAWAQTCLVHQVRRSNA